ncbi:MAG: hypothetical protein ACYDIC_12415 [Desulfobaccales bacterium]
MGYQERLRLKYHMDRYLKNLNENELIQRAKDIISNYLILTDNNLIGVRPMEEDGSYWFVKWVHLLEEFAFRYGPFPSGFPNDFIKDCHIPNCLWPINKKAIQIINKLDLTINKYLIKFGNYKNLKTILEDGIIRISPASSYNDPSLNHAIRDDELKICIYSDVSDCKIEDARKIINERRNQFPKEGNITIKFEVNSDYYIYCLSSMFDCRLFSDFGADSCLIISDPRKFILNLLNAFSKKFNNWKSNGGPVRYIDPIDHDILKLGELDLYLSKHFRYYYQQEYRIVWVPPSIFNKLDYIYLQLDDVQKYCTLIS